MVDPADAIKFNAADLDRLAAEVDDPRRAAALADAAEALRELSADDVVDRDGLIREMADRHFGTFWSYRAKAAEMDRAARRYLAGARWRAHRKRLTLPDELRGTPQEFVWRVMKANGKFPGPVRLRQILPNP